MQLSVGAYGTFSPYVFAIPPYFDDEGDRQEPSIVVHLLGQSQPQLPDSRLSLTIAEAEGLIGQISAVVADAKAGRFPKIGYQAAQEPMIEEPPE